MDRYSRQRILPYVSDKGQKCMGDAKVLIVGAGGLGVPVFMYLVGAGVGTIGIIDGDNIEESNLPRQPIYKERELGRSKVEVLAEYATSISSHTTVTHYNTFYGTDNAEAITKKYDVVVDCTDDLNARLLINDTCVNLGKPFVYGGVFQMCIQLATFNYPVSDGEYSGNFRDAFPVESRECVNCNDGGVLGMVTGMLGNMQAMEVIKIILQKKDILTNSVLTINTENFSQTLLKYRKRKHIMNDAFSEIEIDASEVFSVDDALVIDIRTYADEITEKLHALHIAEGIYDTLPQVNNYQGIIIYCQKGVKSMLFAKDLQNHFPDKHIQVIRGGANALRSIL